MTIAAKKMMPSDWVGLETGERLEPAPAVLPIPKGYRMLIKPVVIEQKTAGGIVLVDESMQYADVACSVGKVVAQGEECYNNKVTRWCEVGDFVLYARHVGQKVEVRNEIGEIEKYMIINDDDVRATVSDPARIRMYL